MTRKHTSTDPAFNTKGLTIAFRHPTPRDDGMTRACATHPDPEIFHPTDTATLSEAKRVCEPCPARATCLAEGLAREEWGVWGGVLLDGGKPLAAPRAPGRPKKVPAA